MRFMPAILARIFKPVPPMDNHTATPEADEVARDLRAAVDEHERVTAATVSAYERDMKAMMDDLFKRMERRT